MSTSSEDETEAEEEIRLLKVELAVKEILLRDWRRFGAAAMPFLEDPDERLTQAIQKLRTHGEDPS